MFGLLQKSFFSLLHFFAGKNYMHLLVRQWPQKFSCSFQYFLYLKMYNEIKMREADEGKINAILTASLASFITKTF